MLRQKEATCRIARRGAGSGVNAALDDLQKVSIHVSRLPYGNLDGTSLLLVTNPTANALYFVYSVWKTVVKKFDTTRNA